MDLPVRKKLTHTIPQWVAEGSWFFITIKCMPPGRNHLCQAGTGDAVLAAMNTTTKNSSGIVGYACSCRIICMPSLRSRANQELKR